MTKQRFPGQLVCNKCVINKSQYEDIPAFIHLVHPGAIDNKVTPKQNDQRSFPSTMYIYSLSIYQLS